MEDKQGVPMLKGKKTTCFGEMKRKGYRKTWRAGGKTKLGEVFKPVVRNTFPAFVST
jgi:hypothetical protein